MGKQIVKVERCSWDVLFYSDIINGRGFIITEPANLEIDKEKKNSQFGSRSPLFGTTYSDEQAFIERHRCECGEFKGRQFEGEICPLCGTEVTAKGTDVNITGWMLTGNNKIINPLFYQLLKKLIGKKIFPDIIDCKLRVDKDGNISKYKPDDEKEPLSPFSGIGLEEFLIQYENIIEYFSNKKKAKKKEFDYLLKNKSKVFTSHIPIYTTMLRPQSVTSDTFYYNGIDREINPLFNLTESIKKCNPIEKPLIMQRIQERVNKMFDFNFNLINGKEGFIRNKLMGGELNYSGRCVIVPDPTLHDDEIDVSYHTFRTLFKYKIIYYLMRINNISLSKAYTKWKQSFVFNRQVYEIMMYIVKKDKPRILINRNPTLKIWCR